MEDPGIDLSTENGIQMLVDMGFSRERAEEAMEKTGNQSVELAASYLLNPDDASEFVDDDEWEDVDYNFKMVFVVNTDLKMLVGKTAAQVAHGCIGLYRDILEKPEYKDCRDGLQQWIDEGQKKIVLSGKDVEQLLQLEEKAKSRDIPCHIVKDAGHTEVAPGSVTVLALFGGEDEVNQITGSLRLLK